MLADHGIAMLPTFLVHEQVGAGQLVALMTDYRWLSAGLYASYRRAAHLPHRVRALLDFLVAVSGG